MGFDDPEVASGLLRGMGWAELAMRFAAFAPGVTCCIVGTANIEHIRENIAAAEKGALPEEVVRSLHEAFRAHDDGWLGQV
jgi:aryl-alcohol dehydrogenase-like predicted oxidoreductase